MTHSSHRSHLHIKQLSLGQLCEFTWPTWIWVGNLFALMRHSWSGGFLLNKWISSTIFCQATVNLTNTINNKIYQSKHVSNKKTMSQQSTDNIHINIPKPSIYKLRLTTYAHDPPSSVNHPISHTSSISLPILWGTLVNSIPSSAERCF